MIREFLAQGIYTPIDPSHFEEKAGRSMTFTLKNYGTKSGLSASLSDPLKTNSTFLIKGPMGTGLGAAESGTYVIVTAGTGILVFLDLIAHLIRKNLSLTPGQTA
jgi:NAD(P)H-flavin reductase